MTPEAFYWCASVFLWSFFTGIGLPPVPEEAGILYAAGLSAIHPEVHWWLAWPATSLGILAADLALYGVGRLWGERLLNHRWMLRMLPLERRLQIEGRFHNHGMKFLLAARLLPPLRSGVFIVAGAIRFSVVRFILADLIYGVVGVGIVFFGGEALMSVIHYLENWSLFAAVIAAVGVGLFVYYRYLRKLEVKAALKVADAVKAVAPDVVASPAEQGEPRATVNLPKH